MRDTSRRPIARKSMISPNCDRTLGLHVDRAAPQHQYVPHTPKTVSTYLPERRVPSHHGSAPPAMGSGSSRAMVGARSRPRQSNLALLLTGLPRSAALFAPLTGGILFGRPCSRMQR
jgi:hypothetical protein